MTNVTPIYDDISVASYVYGNSFIFLKYHKLLIHYRNKYKTTILFLWLK